MRRTAGQCWNAPVITRQQYTPFQVQHENGRACHDACCGRGWTLKLLTYSRQCLSGQASVCSSCCVCSCRNLLLQERCNHGCQSCMCSQAQQVSSAGAWLFWYGSCMCQLLNPTASGNRGRTQHTWSEIRQSDLLGSRSRRALPKAPQ